MLMQYQIPINVATDKFIECLNRYIADEERNCVTYNSMYIIGQITDFNINQNNDRLLIFNISLNENIVKANINTISRISTMINFLNSLSIYWIGEYNPTTKLHEPYKIMSINLKDPIRTRAVLNNVEV